jgi:hypothetical protein
MVGIKLALIIKVSMMAILGCGTKNYWANFDSSRGLENLWQKLP